MVITSVLELKKTNFISSYIVYGDTYLEIRSLNTDMPYYFQLRHLMKTVFQRK